MYNNPIIHIIGCFMIFLSCTFILISYRKNKYVAETHHYRKWYTLAPNHEIRSVYPYQGRVCPNADLLYTVRNRDINELANICTNNNDCKGFVLQQLDTDNHQILADITPKSLWTDCYDRYFYTRVRFARHNNTCVGGTLSETVSKEIPVDQVLDLCASKDNCVGVTYFTNKQQDHILHQKVNNISSWKKCVDIDYWEKAAD